MSKWKRALVPGWIELEEAHDMLLENVRAQHREINLLESRVKAEKAHAETWIEFAHQERDQADELSKQLAELQAKCDALQAQIDAGIERFAERAK